MYHVKVLPAAVKDLDDLEASVFGRIKSRILDLKHQPLPIGVVKLTAEDGYRIRVGDYRILYRIDHKEHAVYIYRVKHRREAYR